jgi:pilus assembly protein CpaF
MRASSVAYLKAADASLVPAMGRATIRTVDALAFSGAKRLAEESKPKVILVVDDDADSAALVESIGRKAGYEVFTAANGEECLSMMSRIAPQLIMLDVNMTGLDGFETCRRVRDQPNGAHVSIAFLTARKTVEDVKRGVAAGADDFIVKPFNAMQLVERFEFMTSRSRLLSAHRTDPSAKSGPPGAWLPVQPGPVAPVFRGKLLLGTAVDPKAGRRGEKPVVVAVPSEPQRRNGAGKAERDRIEAALAALLPVVADRIRPEIAVRMPQAQFDGEVAALVAEMALEAKLGLTASEQAQVAQRVMDEMVGHGPLEGLLADDTVSDILVNGPTEVFVERRGRLEPTDVVFVDEQHLQNVALRMVTKCGRRVDETSPIADARLPDGSRINVVFPPLALHGTMLSIRKFSRKEITLDSMVETGCLSPGMAALLKVATRSRLNILISGGTGAGKTTLLNALSQTINPQERIITIEDAAELKLQLPHVGSLETRPANLEGKNEITMSDLLRNALRMRPDRIILGEVRGAEAFDMLQAMNTGHDGSLGTIHASGPREAITRLENIVLMAGYDLPARFIRSQIASAVHLIVQISRMRDGRRRVTSITEIVGSEGEAVSSQELFSFRADGDGPRGETPGRFVSAGLRPRFLAKAEQYDLGPLLLRAMSNPDDAELLRVS